MKLQAMCVNQECVYSGVREQGSLFCRHCRAKGALYLASEAAAAEQDIFVGKMRSMTTVTVLYPLLQSTCVHGRAGGWGCPHCGYVAP